MIPVLIIALFAIGLVALAGAALGLLRMPDAYCRAQAAGLCDTLGVQVCFVALGLWCFHDGVDLTRIFTALKLGMVAVFLLATSATSTHAVFRALFDNGVKPWTRPARKDGTTP